MSKAFTREDDQAGEDLPISRSLLPPGATNLMTASGNARLRAELNTLKIHRGKLLGEEEDPDTEGQIRRIEARIGEIVPSLASAVVIEQSNGQTDAIQFGSTVTVRDQDELESVYRIVGVDEANFENGTISWLSPIARGLMSAKSGDLVILKLPGGERRLTVMSVT